MLRVFFGGLLAVTAFVCAVLLAAEWVTADRPAAWLGRLVGDSAAGDSQGGQDARSVPAAPDRREPQVVVAASSAQPTAPVARTAPARAGVRRHERHEDPHADEGKESAWTRASDAAEP